MPRRKVRMRARSTVSVGIGSIVAAVLVAALAAPLALGQTTVQVFPLSPGDKQTF